MWTSLVRLLTCHRYLKIVLCSSKPISIETAYILSIGHSLKGVVEQGHELHTDRFDAGLAFTRPNLHQTNRTTHRILSSTMKLKINSSLQQEPRTDTHFTKPPNTHESRNPEAAEPVISSTRAQDTTLTLPPPANVSFCGTFPPEIRNKIYSYLFGADYTAMEPSWIYHTLESGYLIPNDLRNRLTKPRQRLAILRTSHQIKDEALPIFYQQNKLHMCITSDNHVPHLFGDDAVDLIQHLHISIDPRTLPSDTLVQFIYSRSLIERLSKASIPRKSCRITYKMDSRITKRAEAAIIALFQRLKASTSFESLRIEVLLFNQLVHHWQRYQTEIADRLALKLGPSQPVEIDGGRCLLFRPKSYILSHP